MSGDGFRNPVIPISYESTAAIDTGAWSSLKPRDAAFVAPCREACPAGTDIPLFLRLIEQGRFREALAAVLMENPFPGVCGRVCPHPCEANCSRSQFDEAVSIRLLERFISSVDAEPVLPVPVAVRNPRRVAVIGGGPAGLACAYFSAILGHRPTVFEARTEAGGILRWGIPPFRLPRTVVKKEISRILALPVELRTGCRVGRDMPFGELERFDAVFISPGAGINAALSVEGEDLEGVWSGGDFLERLNAGEKVCPGKEVVVIGGGNTAMDVARAARRLGCAVTVAYRRTRHAMPALPDEIREAEEEGVRFQFLVQPLRIRRTRGGKLRVRFQCMNSGAPDGERRPRVLPVKGQFTVLEADSVIGAVGEGIDGSWLPRKLVKDGLVDVRDAPKFFAGGDAASRQRTVVSAIGAAKRAAIEMDLFFQGNRDAALLPGLRTGNKGSLSLRAYVEFRRDGMRPEALDVLSGDGIRTLYFEKSGRLKPRKLGGGRRLKTNGEVVLPPGLEEALRSARRCFSCGRCNACANCFYFCPEGAVAIDPGRGTRTVDLRHCKGCGTCARACPRGAIAMEERP